MATGSPKRAQTAARHLALAALGNWVRSGLSRRKRAEGLLRLALRCSEMPGVAAVSCVSTAAGDGLSSTEAAHVTRHAAARTTCGSVAGPRRRWTGGREAAGYNALRSICCSPAGSGGPIVIRSNYQQEPPPPRCYTAHSSVRRGVRQQASARAPPVGVSRHVAKYGAARPDRKSTRLNSSHSGESRMPSSA